MRKTNLGRIVLRRDPLSTTSSQRRELSGRDPQLLTGSTKPKSFELVRRRIYPNKCKDAVHFVLTLDELIKTTFVHLHNIGRKSPFTVYTTTCFFIETTLSAVDLPYVPPVSNMNRRSHPVNDRNLLSNSLTNSVPKHSFTVWYFAEVGSTEDLLTRVSCSPDFVEVWKALNHCQ